MNINRFGSYETSGSGPLSWEATMANISHKSNSDFGNLGRAPRSRFFRAVQDLFIGSQKGHVHARKRHHHFRHPEEGAARPGFISSGPQSERPGFIAGLGQASAAVGAEILSETKEKGSQLLLIMLVLGILLWTKTRIF